jgi:hypothetical protein
MGEDCNRETCGDRVRRRRRTSAAVPDVQRLRSLDITRRVIRFGHLGRRSGSVSLHCLCSSLFISFSFNASSYDMWLWLKFVRLQGNIAGRDFKSSERELFYFLESNR